MATSLHESYLQYIQMCGTPDCSVHLDVVDICSLPLLDFFFVEIPLNTCNAKMETRLLKTRMGTKLHCLSYAPLQSCLLRRGVSGKRGDFRDGAGRF